MSGWSLVKMIFYFIENHQLFPHFILFPLRFCLNVFPPDWQGCFFVCNKLKEIFSFSEAKRKWRDIERRTIRQPRKCLPELVWR